MRLFQLLVPVSLLCFTLTVKAEINQPLQNSLDAKHRSTANKARDQFRHPLQTLEFFDVKPDMTVVEIWPGGGWYSEILAPYLRDEGQLVAAHFSKDSKVPYFTKSVTAFIKKTSANPEIYSKVLMTELDAPEKVNIAPAGSADRVLTFRNVHNWMKAGQADAVFKAMFSALKNGGILGVVEHRAGSDKEQDQQAKSGYVREDYVIALAEKAGFKLVEKSELNANPKDTKNHPAGVWTLPPSLRLKDKNKQLYQEIGESDRMTLKFVKP